MKENVPHKTLGSLLALLRQYAHLDVPSDPRTLLQTPKSSKIKQIETGKLLYLGITDGLRKINLPSVQPLSLSFNMDGMSLFRSSNITFWVLSGAIESKVFTVAIYQGRSKPPLFPFLKDFINECLELSMNGLLINGYHYQIKVGHIVCDSPAKSFVKNVVQFNAKCGCDKCSVIGLYVSNRITFHSTTSPLRSNESFRYKH